MKRFNFECYFKKAKTGELGWNIHIVVIIADNKQTAIDRLRSIPCFDCIITHDRGCNVDTANLTAEDYEAMQGYVIDDTLL